MKRSGRILAVLAVLLLGRTARADYIITDLGTFGGTYSNATAINRFGQVVGSATFAGNPIAHAFLYSNGVMQDLGTIGGVEGAFSVATALNNSGQVVGNSNVTSLGGHAFLYSNGAMHDLGTLGGGAQLCLRHQRSRASGGIC